MPLPRDERTLGEVERLRRSLADVQALWEVGKDQAALAKAIALRPEVEATGYKPLLAQLLVSHRTGPALRQGRRGDSRESIFHSCSCARRHHGSKGRDESDLLGRSRPSAGTVMPNAGRAWRTRCSIAPGTTTRACARGYFRTMGRFSGPLVSSKRALALFQQAVVLKEASVGGDHPDVAISLDSVAWALVALDRPNEALAAADRAFSIHAKHTDPGGMMFANSLTNRGQSLLAVGRTPKRGPHSKRPSRSLDSHVGPDLLILADATAGLGQLELAEGRPADSDPALWRMRFSNTGAFKTPPYSRPMPASRWREPYGKAAVIADARGRSRPKRETLTSAFGGQSERRKSRHGSRSTWGLRSRPPQPRGMTRRYAAEAMARAPR